MTANTAEPTPRPTVTPLDPNSDKGRDVAARLSRVFADIEDEIATRPKTKPA